MENKTLNLQSSEQAIVAAASRIFAAYIVSGQVSEGQEEGWLARAVREAIWLAAAVFGLSLLAATFSTAFLVLKYCGAAYLLWLAWKMWRAPVNGPEMALPERGSAIALFASGMAITLGNPKIMAFYLALLPAIIKLDSVGVLGWLELTATMLAVLITIDLSWVAAASAARRFLRSPRAVRLVNRLGATAMGGAAVVIAARN